MCAKKKTKPNKMWKIAGESLHSQPLSAEEQERFDEEFSIYRIFRGNMESGPEWVSPAAAKINQSAAQSVGAFLCDRYANRYERDRVVKVVAATAAIPFPRSARMASRAEDFLLGAALWLLDYWEEYCADEDEYLTFLPLEPDKVLECRLPFVEDLSHSWETMLRTLTVLCGRDKAYRKEFRALMDLIDADAAAGLRKLFMDAFLDYMDRAMEIDNRLRPVAQTLPSLGNDPRHLLENGYLPLSRSEIDALFAATELICRPISEIQEDLGSRKVAELLSGYGTDEPYALCAAYLLLEKEKDALANLNALTAIVMVCAALHLPWTQDDFGARTGLREQGSPNYRLRYEYREISEDGETDWVPYPGWLASEAQLFYIATGIVLPRDRQPSSELIRWFMIQGIAEPRARELAFGAMFACYADTGEYSRPEHDLTFDEICKSEETPSAETEDSSPALLSAEGQTAQIELLNRKIKELRGALHDAERAAGHFKDQLRLSEERENADRAELAQLRETLYHLKEAESPEAGEPSPLLELPWQIKRRVVVFGGGDNWRKAIKPLLPGARFYDRDELPDVNIVRGADVVWLQANAISHKFYYQVIDTARKNNIPVRYFGASSAKKCAMQLALNELVAGGEQGKI